MKGIILIAAFASGCASLAVRETGSPAAFPFHLSYTSDYKSVRIEIDEHRVVTLTTSGQERLYGKIYPGDFDELKALVTSPAFRQSLSELGESSRSGDTYRHRVLTLYGIATFGSGRRPKSPRYNVLLDETGTTSEPVASLIRMVDSSCAKVFGERYIPMIAGGGWTPNNSMNLPVRPVTARARARSAPGRPAGYAER